MRDVAVDFLSGEGSGDPEASDEEEDEGVGEIGEGFARGEDREGGCQDGDEERGGGEGEGFSEPIEADEREDREPGADRDGVASAFGDGGKEAGNEEER